MKYFTVRFTLTPAYLNLADADREAYRLAEIDYGKVLYKQGIWLQAYTEPDHNNSWAIYKAESLRQLDAYLEGYPMHAPGFYTRKAWEVTVVEPPKIVGFLLKLARALRIVRRQPPMALVGRIPAPALSRAAVNAEPVAAH